MIEFQPYSPDREAAVREFNRRLAAGGCPFRFPESARPYWLPPGGDDPIFEEFFLATEASSVHGGYVLKHQPFLLAGESLSIGYIGLPLSEGVVDKRFNLVGMQVFSDALARQPLNYCLGMGGVDRPLPRFLKATGWAVFAVPFYFMVLRPRAFLRNIVILRQRRRTSVLFDLAAFSGLGTLGGAAFNLIRRPRRSSIKHLSCEPVARFDAWADDLWFAARGQFHFIAIRTAKAMNRLYPPDKEKYLRLKISVNGAPVGWALALDTQMTGHKQFGNTRVGSIIDCVAAPGSEAAVVLAATHHLEDRGVDLIVTNQSHRAWRDALRHAGYLAGPSNYVFAASPKLGERLTPFDQIQERIHITRADGEGPSHL